MGLFDYLRCEIPLPAVGCEGYEFQTKDTPSQYMENYVIRADGSLWVEEYDIEDRSDPKAEGLQAICGMMTRVNERWTACDSFTGEICFTKYEDDYSTHVLFSSYFDDGKLKFLKVIEDTRKPAAPTGQDHGAGDV